MLTTPIIQQLQADNAELRLELEATIGIDYAGLPGWRPDSSQVWGHHTVAGYRRQVSRGFNPPRWCWYVDRRRAAGGYVTVAGGDCPSPREAMRQANRRHTLLVSVDHVVAAASLSLEHAAAARNYLIAALTAEGSAVHRRAINACCVAGVSVEVLGGLLDALAPLAADQLVAEVS